MRDGTRMLKCSAAEYIVQSLKCVKMLQKAIQERFQGAVREAIGKFLVVAIA